MKYAFKIIYSGSNGANEGYAVNKTELLKILSEMIKDGFTDFVITKLKQ